MTINSENNKTKIYSNDKIKKTKTYSDSKQLGTQKYSDSINEKTTGTKTYEDKKSEINKTIGYDEDVTKRMDKTKAHNLGINDIIEFNGNKYTVIGVISEENTTGEAVIYKIKDHEEQVFALKLYYFFRDPKEEPNPESLERIKKITDPDILKLYDYGTGANKFQNKFCYEICDYAKGGDLLSVNNISEKYTPEFINSNVIPEIYKGIRRLHKNRIYHCDLKPENVFFLDANQTDLVIGDYGSAKTFGTDFSKSFKFTKFLKGTPFYNAPELFEYVVSEKNDYYSFGMIILRLLYPEMVIDEKTERETFHHIRERRYAGKKIINFNPSYGNLNTLIEGLTLRDYNTRWGEKEVEKWLNGESVEVIYPTKSYIAPMKLGKATILTKGDLINFIENNADWSEDLIQDETGYNWFLTWVSQLQDLQCKKVFDRMVRYYQQDGEGYYKEAILRYFDPERPIKIDMNTYNFFSEEELSGLVNSFFKQIDDIWKFTGIEKIRFYIFQFEFCLRQLDEISKQELKLHTTAILEKISAILNVKPKDDFSDYQAVLYPQIDDNKLLDLFYAFNKERVFKDIENNSFNTIEEVGLLLAKNEELFDNKFVIIEKQKFFNNHDRKELNEFDYIDTLIKIFSNNVMSNIEFIDLNDIKDDKSKIKYKFQISLTEFFNSKNINKTFLKRSSEINEFEFDNDSDCGWLQFLKHLKSKHNILDKDLSSNNKKEFRSKLLIQNEQNKLNTKIAEIKEKFKNREKLLKDTISSIKYSDNYDYYENNNWCYLWGGLALMGSYLLILFWR
ncbi:MAG: hypothetical protein K9H48_19470 [Melioribacteraceae bacterium]|nr:hypothetical protein [Melioribacteraceae bacterium]